MLRMYVICTSINPDPCFHALVSLIEPQLVRDLDFQRSRIAFSLFLPWSILSVYVMFIHLLDLCSNCPMTFANCQNVCNLDPHHSRSTFWCYGHFEPQIVRDLASSLYTCVQILLWLRMYVKLWLQFCLLITWFGQTSACMSSWFSLLQIRVLNLCLDLRMYVTLLVITSYVYSDPASWADFRT